MHGPFLLLLDKTHTQQQALILGYALRACQVFLLFVSAVEVAQLLITPEAVEVLDIKITSQLLQEHPIQLLLEQAVLVDSMEEIPISIVLVLLPEVMVVVAEFRLLVETMLAMAAVMEVLAEITTAAAAVRGVILAMVAQVLLMVTLMVQTGQAAAVAAAAALMIYLVVPAVLLVAVVVG